MKVSIVLLACAYFAALAGADDVVAYSRAQLIVPVEPCVKVIGVPASESSPAVVRFEVRGKPGETFTLVATLRTPEGQLILDPVTGLPLTTVVPGLLLPPTGVWFETHALTSLASGLPDYMIEVAAVPSVVSAGDQILSWTCKISTEDAPPSPPAFQSQLVSVPGVAGIFLSTTIATPATNLGSEGNLFFLAENGPGGVYPIG